jgi:hypothetical protein
MLCRELEVCIWISRFHKYKYKALFHLAYIRNFFWGGGVVMAKQLDLKESSATNFTRVRLLCFCKYVEWC